MNGNNSPTAENATPMTWCRACGGGGDFFDGDDYYTCGVCGGLGEHEADRGPYGVAGDGIEAFYEPPTTERPLLHLLPPVPAPLPRRLSPRRLPLWRRVLVNLLTPDCAPEAGVTSTVVFAGLAVVAAAYAIFQLLTGGAA